MFTVENKKIKIPNIRFLRGLSGKSGNYKGIKSNQNKIPFPQIENGNIPTKMKARDIQSGMKRIKSFTAMSV